MIVHTRSLRPRRTAFTLVEMLVVFLIIAILVGILVPVIAGAYRRGKEAAELTEVNSLVTALQMAKDRFGGFAPSQIVLIEDGDYSPANWNDVFTGSTSGNGEVYASPGGDGVFLRSVSIQYLRKFWPQLPIRTDGLKMDLDNDGTRGEDPDDLFDWNGDGNPGSPGSLPHVFFLTGDECLVFFLGGVPTGQYVVGGATANRPANVTYNPKTYPPGVLGFSKDPRFPMLQPSGTSGSAGRDGPFFEFDGGRLTDRDDDGFWEYLPLRKPAAEGGYAYFSSYDGTGYRPDDLNFATEYDGSSSLPSIGLIEYRVRWQRHANYPSANTPSYSGAPTTNVVSEGPNPYTIGPPMIDTQTVDRYWKPDAFQIISPGLDGFYGQGGAVERLGRKAFTSRPGGPAYEEVRADDDNLTNFITGELKDYEAK